MSSTRMARYNAGLKSKSATSPVMATTQMLVSSSALVRFGYDTK